MTKKIDGITIEEYAELNTFLDKQVHELYNQTQLEEKTRNALLHYIQELEEIIEFSTEINLSQLNKIRDKSLTKEQQLFLNSYA